VKKVFKLVIVALIFLPCVSEVLLASGGEILSTEVYIGPDTDISEKFIEFLSGEAGDTTIDVRMAFYDIDIPEIVNKLIELKNSGITVEVVVDDSNINTDEIKRLKKVVTVKSDKSGALMHNKFCVITRHFSPPGPYSKLVWTGSWNATYNGTHFHNNNALIIRDTDVADRYANGKDGEFDEMFLDGQFGANSPTTNSVSTSFTLTNGISGEVYFAPEDNEKNVMGKIVEEVEKAQSSVYFLAYSFTHDDLARAIKEKYKKNLKVIGIFEKSQVNASSAYTQYYPLKKAGVEVFLDINSYNLHHKVIIIDKKTVITGSFNFSNSANEKNDENIVIIREDGTRGVVKKYIDEFNRLYAAIIRPLTLYGQVREKTAGTYIPDVTISLSGTAIKDVAPVAISDTEGWYSFKDVTWPAGDLLIRYEKDGYFANEWATIEAIYLKNKRFDLTLEAISPYATITGEVYDDRNGDGVRDENEPGLEGVTVKIGFTRAADNIVTYIKGITDSMGKYQITPVPDPDYPETLGTLNIYFEKLGYQSKFLAKQGASHGSVTGIKEVGLTKTFKVTGFTNPIFQDYISIAIYDVNETGVKPTVHVQQNNYIPVEVECVQGDKEFLWLGTYKILKAYSGSAKIIVNGGAGIGTFDVLNLEAKEGATFEALSRSVYLNIEKNVLLKETLFTAIISDIPFSQEGIYIFKGPVSLGPAKPSLQKPVSLAFSLNDIKADMIKKLGIYKFNSLNQIWEYIPSSIRNNKIVANVVTLGTFALIGDISPPTINMTDDKIIITDNFSGVRVSEIEFKVNGIDVAPVITQKEQGDRKVILDLPSEYSGHIEVLAKDKYHNLKREVFEITATTLQIASFKIYPVPSDSEVNISCDVTKECKLKVVIRDTAGRRVYVFRRDNVPKGTNIFKWNAENRKGQLVSNGVYFVFLTAQTDNEKVSVYGKAVILR